LAHHALGQLGDAKGQFEQALILTDKAEQARRVSAATAGMRDADGIEWNNPEDYASDHHMMMKRMIGQRLAEVNLKLKK
jgi:hypothetical protein